MENTCYSRGNILAKLMIVGQAPGREESTKMWEDSKTNRSVRIPVPFCGVAGILLMDVLHSLDIREGDYIMTNTVKFFPVSDVEDRLRPPTMKEVEDARPDLVREILTIKPITILAFGAEAMWATVYYGVKPINTVHSTEENGNKATVTFKDGTNEHTCTVVMIMHPSYIRRIQTNKASRQDDYGEAMTNFLTAFVNNKAEIEKAIGRELLLLRPKAKATGMEDIL